MAHSKDWLEHAMVLLEESLHPVPHELNELDWKSDISKKDGSLQKHLSAFANHSHGGYLVFGISDTGQPIGVEQNKIKLILEKIGNAARNGVDPKVTVDHVVEDFNGCSLLFVYIKESPEKPVHLSGKGFEASYIRNSASSQKMSKQEIGRSLLNSKVSCFEEQTADSPTSAALILRKIDTHSFLKLLEKPEASSEQATMKILEEHRLVNFENRSYSITNLGAMVAARNMADFSMHVRRGIRVITYKSTSKIEATKDQTFNEGYAISFDEVLNYIEGQLPTSEVISDAFRKQASVYPKVAIREILANAIIHQDFNIDGVNPRVEIFADRMEITNPGALISKTSVDRLIGSTRPRNELFARAMYKLRVCEDRGSGLLRALDAIELYGLPPLRFDVSEADFKVTLFSPKNYQLMTPKERVDACYQHCILKHLSNQKMTNATLRKRLGISEKNYPFASKIIREAIDQNKIKVANPEYKNAKYTSYVPFFA